MNRPFTIEVVHQHVWNPDFIRPFPLLTPYSASKWAVRGFTQGCAMEWGELTTLSLQMHICLTNLGIPGFSRSIWNPSCKLEYLSITSPRWNLTHHVAFDWRYFDMDIMSLERLCSVSLAQIQSGESYGKLMRYFILRVLSQNPAALSVGFNLNGEASDEYP